MCGVDQPPRSSAEVKETVELHIYSLSGPSWSVLGRTLPLPYFGLAFDNLEGGSCVLSEILSVKFGGLQDKHVVTVKFGYQ